LSLSVTRLPSCRKTASVSAPSRSPRPRTTSVPCSATNACSALRCSAAQRAASPVAVACSTGGLLGCRPRSGSEVGNECVISAPPFASSSGGPAGNRGTAASERHRSRDFPLQAAIDQVRLIGEHRVTNEVLEGYRAVKGNRQLQSGQRRTAPVEEVIPPADLCLGNTEHLRPRGCQPVLGRRTGSVPALSSDIELCGERRQRPLVDLTVVRQRQTVPPVKDRRDYVLGQRRTHPLPQRVGINWPLTGIEGHQVPAAVGPLRDDDRVLADAGHAQQGVFDLPDLDPEATDLDLSVSAAEKLELPLGQPAAIVPTPVQPFVRVVRIGQERSLRALAIIDVSPADTYPGEDDFTWRAERHGRQM